MKNTEFAQGPERETSFPLLSEQSEDRELVLAHKNGDQNAFPLLVKKNRQTVFNHCLRIVKDVEECADLTQEVFIKVFLNLENYKPQYAFKTWLYRITHNCCIDLFRKTKRRGPRVSLSVSPGNNSNGEDSVLDISDSRFCPERKMNARQFEEIFSAAIGRLSNRVGVTFLLKEVVGLTNQEIGVILGCPVNTVRTRMRNARQKLKVLLEPPIEKASGFSTSPSREETRPFLTKKQN